MPTMQIEVPDELAESIRERGLWNPDALESMLREALRSGALAFISENVAENGRLGLPVMSECEIQEEIRAMRSEKRLFA